MSLCRLRQKEKGISTSNPADLDSPKLSKNFRGTLPVLRWCCWIYFMQWICAQNVWITVIICTNSDLNEPTVSNRVRTSRLTMQLYRYRQI